MECEITEAQVSTDQIGLTMSSRCLMQNWPESWSQWMQCCWLLFLEDNMFSTRYLCSDQATTQSGNIQPFWYTLDIFLSKPDGLKVTLYHKIILWALILFSPLAPTGQLYILSSKQRVRRVTIKQWHHLSPHWKIFNKSIITFSLSCILYLDMILCLFSPWNSLCRF